MSNLNPKLATGADISAPAGGQLYEKRKAVYPRQIDGRFRRFKWLVMAVTLTIYCVGTGAPIRRIRRC